MSDTVGLRSLEKTVYEEMQRPDVEAIVPVTARRILDVGCGAGNLGAALKTRNRDVSVTGIEMSPALAAIASGRIDRVLTGTIEEHIANLPDGTFDCMIFADVLEHMINPHQVLRDLRPKLDPERGVLVASIPNVRHWLVLRELVLRGRWEYAERGLLDSGHLRFFTEQSILSMVAWAGYRVEFVDMVGSAPRPLWWCNRLLAGRLRPFIAYQYLIVARPVSGRDLAETPWWEAGLPL